MTADYMYDTIRRMREYFVVSEDKKYGYSKVKDKIFVWVKDLHCDLFNDDAKMQTALDELSDKLGACVQAMTSDAGVQPTQ